MPCILCLESKDELSFDIFSAEGKELNAQDIVKQHFWIKPSEDDDCKLICQRCWGYVFEFHEFYLQIQEAHQILVESKFSEHIDPISNEFFDSEFEKKVDANVDRYIEELALNAPRLKRSRSCRNVSKVCEALNETPIDANLTPFDEKLNVDVLINTTNECSNTPIQIRTNSRKPKTSYTDQKIKKRRGRPSKKDKPKLRTNDISIKLNQDNDFQNEFDHANLENENLDIDFKIERNTEKAAKSVRRDLSHFDEFIKENIKLSCALCKIPCENFTTLQTHFRIEHKCHGYVICCGKKLLKRGVLVDHLYTHKDPEYFKCSDCGKVLADRRCLELHKQTHEEKREKNFKCDICSKMFHLKPVFRRHVDSHVPKELREFECSQCLKRFASKCLMNNHFRIVHLNKYSQVCDICGKKIHGRETFRLHQEQHKGVPKELLNCDICGIPVTSKYGLKRHQKVKHTEKYQIPQQCEFCSKISPNITALNRHVYYMHGLERKHQCSMCDKAFKRPKDLKEHLSTHTGGILYFCTYCPRTFNSNANMYAHRKRKHPKEWEQNHKEKNTSSTFDTNLNEDLVMLLETG